MCAYFTGYFAKRSSSDYVSDAEQITRYILQRRGHHSAEKGIVKYGAFMPPPNGRMSVYRTSSLDDNGIWQIGQRYVAQPQGKAIVARGDVTTKLIRGADAGVLDVVPAPNPHRLHAHIIGWPTRKDEQMMLAKELARFATLELPEAQP
jgi:hypothetical protein